MGELIRLVVSLFLELVELHLHVKRAWHVIKQGNLGFSDVRLADCWKVAHIEWNDVGGSLKNNRKVPFNEVNEGARLRLVLVKAGSPRVRGRT